MSRRRSAVKRNIVPDSRYGDKLLAKFINKVMWDGKRSIAERIVYSALDMASTKNKQGCLDIFKTAIEHVMPSVEVKSRRVGGATYQIPVPVQQGRAEALAIRWLVDAARDKGGSDMATRLGGEISAAFQGTGIVVKKKEDTHKMASANQAFSHYRW